LVLAHGHGATIPPGRGVPGGRLHFVHDGHHRVSVTRTLNLASIDADVTMVQTRLSIGDIEQLTGITVSSGHDSGKKR
jgi:hypothetical protein